MLDNHDLVKSVSNILQRSERQTDVDRLADIYVDSGILPQLQNRNNQILYGRRGTGKTHILKVLLKQIEAEKGSKAIYVDCRTFGSSSQFTDATMPMGIRCLSLFKDFSGIIYNELLETIADLDKDKDQPFELLVDLSNALSVRKETLTTESLKVTESDSDRYDLSLSAEVNSRALKLGGGVKNSSESATRTETNFTVKSEDKVVFGDIHALLGKILERLGIDLFLLIDEWSSLPMDIQPYFAEFLKRSCLPCNRVSVKIAALEYRSEFHRKVDGLSVGIEPGADITIALDIDDYYVYDRNPLKISKLFSSILYRHIESGLPRNYFKDVLRVADPGEFPSRVFTSSKVFDELVRASEGVVRDLINIFMNAYFDSLRRGRVSIDRQSVIESARSWFEKDKSEALDDDLRKFLERIVGEVIGKKKARSFMLPRELQKHQTIQRLFDLRVIHLVQRGYADRDNPGKRYNVYCLDYGTYVDMIQTKSMPADFLVIEEASDEQSEWIVPFDDKRSIRRIILQEDVLE